MIARLARGERVDLVGLRRNLVVSRINLLALKNAKIQIRAALIEVVGPCQPFSRAWRSSSVQYVAMRAHGGMTAHIPRGGPIHVGEIVRAEP